MHGLDDTMMNFMQIRISCQENGTGWRFSFRLLSSAPSLSERALGFWGWDDREGLGGIQSAYDKASLGYDDRGGKSDDFMKNA